MKNTHKKPNRFQLEFESDIIMIISCCPLYFFNCYRFRPIDKRGVGRVVFSPVGLYIVMNYNYAEGILSRCKYYIIDRKVARLLRYTYKLMMKVM